EVFKALNKTRGLYLRWREIGDTSAAESEWTTTELRNSVSVQQRMLQGQDEQLDVISDSIGTLKTVSRQIGIELDEQAVMLDDFGNEMETTESKIDSTMKKVAKVLHMNNDNRQWMAIIVLSILLLLKSA
ncbi:Syntaxin-6, partial [Pseudolycoriella hygida]